MTDAILSKEETSPASHRRRDWVVEQAVGPPHLEIDGQVGLGLAVLAVVVSRGEHHRVVGSEPRECLIAPVRGELRRQIGMLFLRIMKVVWLVELSSVIIVALS